MLVTSSAAWEHVRAAVSHWRETALGNGVPPAELRQFESVMSRH